MISNRVSTLISIAGKFVTKIAGVYSITLITCSGPNLPAMVGVFVNYADGSGEDELCRAHAVPSKNWCFFCFGLLWKGGRLTNRRMKRTPNGLTIHGLRLRNSGFESQSLSY